MIGLAIVGGLVTLAVLAVIGKSVVNAAQPQTVPPINDNTVTSVDNMVSRARPAGDENYLGGGIVGLSDWQAGNQITTDYTTWPSGDAIWDICRAIAKAEGYDTNGAAFKLNNPGDISDGAAQFGSQPHGGSNITTFPDAATGWNWLYNKISNHINGLSSTYPKTMTIDQFAHKYAGQWQPWERIVASELGVSVDTTFADYVGV